MATQFSLKHFITGEKYFYNDTRRSTLDLFTPQTFRNISGCLRGLVIIICRQIFSDLKDYQGGDLSCDHLQSSIVTILKFSD